MQLVGVNGGVCRREQDSVLVPVEDWQESLDRSRSDVHVFRHSSRLHTPASTAHCSADLSPTHTDAVDSKQCKQITKAC